jgi:nickel-dependent lactate racemase
MQVRIKSGVWYGDREKVLDFPDGWKVSVLKPRGGVAMSDEQVKTAILTPIGTERLSVLSGGKKTAAVICDDISRPTPCSRLLPSVLDELRGGGIEETDITIIVGAASHRPSMREDLIKKLGVEVLDRYRVIHHNPYCNLVSLGPSSRGTPVYLHRDVMAAEVKVGMGTILPHGASGFSGGAKILVPGVAGIETIIANHKLANTPRGVLEGNAMRADSEEIAGLAGLDFIVNTLVDGDLNLVGVFAGHTVYAHRAGVQAARKIYHTKFPQNMDMVITNTYPADTDFYQADKGLWSDLAKSVRPGGYVFAFAECPEGLGFHGGVAAGINIYKGHDNVWTERKVGIVSPNLGPYDVRVVYPDSVMLFHSWVQVKEYLAREGVSSQPLDVAVYPCAPIQLLM